LEGEEIVIWLKVFGAVALLWVLLLAITEYHRYSLSIYVFKMIGNYKQLAHIYLRNNHWSDHPNRNRREEDAAFRRTQIAERLLRNGGGKALDGILAELKRANSVRNRTVLSDLLVSIGDMKALPVIEQLYNQGYLFDSFGTASPQIERFLERNSLSIRQKKNAEEGEAAARLARAINTVKSLSDARMVEILKQLCVAYSTDDKSAILELEPLATAIGRELNRRGGVSEMRQYLDELKNMRGTRTLDMHWNGIGDWRG
jgi:hypothetical protein